MTRLRGAYDALQQTWPVAVPPDPLIDAMQTGDRLGYHPERAVEEIAHFHEQLPTAQAAVATVGSAFSGRLDDYAKRMASDPLRPADMDAAKQSRSAAMARATLLLNAGTP
jgi:alpha-glucosidase